MASISDQNWVVWNQGKNPLVNFNFMLRVEMMFDLPCRSVRAFTRELEYDYIQEGGLNDYVHMRRKPISRPFTLEIERYVGVDYADPLPLGADLVLPVLLFVSRAHDQFIPGVVARTYVFTGCTVTKKTYGDLVADQSGLLVETTTIAYREMLCVDIPWSEVGDNIFGSTTTLPTQAATADKSAGDMKPLGAQLYEKAKQAKAQADTHYQAEQAEKLIANLEEVLQKLEAQLSDAGGLTVALEQARTGLEAADDSDEADKAKQAQQKERDEREKVRLSQADWEKKNQIYTDLLNRKEELEEKQEKAKAHTQQLNAQLAKLKGEEKELEAKVPQEMRDPRKARTAADEAGIKAEKAREAVSDARRACEQAQRDLDSKIALNAARKAEQEKTLANQAGQAAQRRQTAENLAAVEEENNLRLAQELEQAQEIYNNAQQNLSNDLEQQEKELEKAKQAKENSDEALARRKEELEQARQAEEAAVAAAAAGATEAADTQAEEKALEEKKAAMEQAEQARDAALAARKTAVETLENSTALAGMKDEILDLKNRIEEAAGAEKEAGEENKDLTADISAAKTAVDAAKTQLDSDQKALDEATARSAAAEETLKSAREAKDKAREALKTAEENYNRAKRSLNPIRNNLTNLKARKEKSDDYLKNCAGSLEECGKANTALQGLPDEPLSAVNSAYEQVRKHYKDTSFYERQLREIKNYIDQGSELYEEVKDVLPKETTKEDNPAD